MHSFSSLHMSLMMWLVIVNLFCCFNQVFSKKCFEMEEKGLMMMHLMKMNSNPIGRCDRVSTT